jgi:hypothetical protein
MTSATFAPGMPGIGQQAFQPWQAQSVVSQLQQLQQMLQQHPALQQVQLLQAEIERCLQQYPVLQQVIQQVRQQQQQYFPGVPQPHPVVQLLQTLQQIAQQPQIGQTLEQHPILRQVLQQRAAQLVQQLQAAAAPMMGAYGGAPWSQPASGIGAQMPTPTGIPQPAGVSAGVTG